MRHPAKRCTYDDTLLVTVLVLVIAGLVLLTSISAYNGNVKFHDSFYYLKKAGLCHRSRTCRNGGYFED